MNKATRDLFAAFPILFTLIVLASCGGGGGGQTLPPPDNPLNTAPEAHADNLTTPEDSLLEVGAPGVLTNDTDSENDSLTAHSVSLPEHGSLVFHADGSLSYSPNADFNGQDTFTYFINDGDLDSGIATVTITVTPVNDSPVANNDTASTPEDTPVIVDVLSNDTDIDVDLLTITDTTDGTIGSVSLNADNTVTYKPSANAYGLDSFTYTASDNNGGEASGVVNISVMAVNDPPLVRDDSVTQATAVNIPILINDIEVEGGQIILTAFTQGSHGTTTRNPDNSITYEPNLGFDGVDFFTYTAEDEDGAAATATVIVTVSAYPSGQAIERVSVASDGTQASGVSINPAITADGSKVVFDSNAANLVAGDTNGVTDVFMRDRFSDTTTRESVASNGVQGNSWSSYGSISGNGNYLGFHSYSSTLGGQGSYLRRLTDGVTLKLGVGTTMQGAFSENGKFYARETFTNIIVTDTSDLSTETISGTSMGYTYCLRPAISAMGGHIACEGSGVTDEILLYDRQTTEFSVIGSDMSRSPSLSANGRYVAFSSSAPALVHGDNNNISDIFVYDRLFGTYQRVSVASDGTEANNDSQVTRFSISGDGRFVVFNSLASNLVSDDTNGVNDIYVHDLHTSQTSRVSVAANGTQGNGGSYSAAISLDGRYIVFTSFSTNLVSGDTNDSEDVYIVSNPLAS